MKLNRKQFLTSAGILGLFPILNGCRTPGPWTDADTQKLIATLEQAGLVLAVTLGKDATNRKYLELAATSLEQVVADGKIDPSDIVTIILANVKNNDVVLGITTALTIYRIWFNDNTLSTTQGVQLIAALARGLRNGLSVQIARAKSAVPFVVPTFSSKSLDNAAKDFFKRYK